MLVDTSALLRILQPLHPQLEIARTAIKTLWREVATFISRAPQKHVCAAAGNPAIYPAWETLVTRHKVSGKPAHDARLVAAMQVHGLTAILTFDKSGFTRYAGIKVLHPADVAAAES